MYSLYLYFLCLSLRNTSKALRSFKDQNRSNVAVWEWIQRFGSLQIYNKHRRISAFIIDETIIQIGGQHFWLWTCFKPVHRSLESMSQKGEKCFLLKDSLDLWLGSMENMLGLQLEVHGLMKHVISCDSNIIYIHHLRKV